MVCIMPAGPAALSCRKLRNVCIWRQAGAVACNTWIQTDVRPAADYWQIGGKLLQFVLHILWLTWANIWQGLKEVVKGDRKCDIRHIRVQDNSMSDG